MKIVRAERYASQVHLANHRQPDYVLNKAALEAEGEARDVAYKALEVRVVRYTDPGMGDERVTAAAFVLEAQDFADLRLVLEHTAILSPHDPTAEAHRRLYAAVATYERYRGES